MKKRILRVFPLLLVIPMILSLIFPGTSAFASTSPTSSDSASNDEPQFANDTLAAAANSVQLLSKDGKYLLDINHTNTNIDAPQLSKYVAIFTSGAKVTNTANDNEVFVKLNNVAIQVNKDGKIIKVNGPDANPPKAWDANETIEIPVGGYVVLANDDAWGTSAYRKPLFINYQLGDTIKLLREGVEVTAKDFVSSEPSSSPSSSPSPTPSASTDPTPTPTPTPSPSTSPSPTPSPGAGDILEVEAAPSDITIGVEGPKKVISYVDKDVTGISNIIALFTTDFGPSITVAQFNVAVQIGADSKVLKVVNQSLNGGAPSWTGPTDIEVPENGYVLLAQDDSYATKDIKSYLATKFKVGDTIKLRKNKEVVSVLTLMSGKGPKAKLTVDNFKMYTVTESATTITGMVSNVKDFSSVVLKMNDTVVPIASNGSFSYAYPIASGTNYVDVTVTKNGEEQGRQHIVVFGRPGFSSEKEVILWVDQAANARKFQSSKSVLDFLKKAKDNGVTSVVFDVKGVEGFVSYKKNDLTGRPYVSEIKAPEKAGSNPDLDLLQEFIDHGHELGLKIHAAINVFAEGSIASKEYAVLDKYLDWEERLYSIKDNGVIKPVRDSEGKGLVAFVNPANDDVRDYQLKTFEEIIKNYDVDGVVHDRGRYDNESADFSDETRIKFEAFLAARNKTLENWPTDIFKYENNARVDGPLIQDWWEFRSSVIKSFFGEAKALVDSYETNERKIQISSYVGSWYESYYLNGVNWGSTNFRNDPRLGLNKDALYTPEYYETGYIENIDFLMIGAYQTTQSEVEKYITLGNIVTNGETPLYAGIALTNVQAPALQREIFQAGLRTTNGLMLFDASQVNWPVASAAIRDVEYVKDYQLGISIPGSPKSFIEGNYHNINLIEGNINVLSDSFGYSTGSSRFGVEAVVDADGVVTRVANRNQAINWSWNTPEETNSVIPQKGFVVSTLDPSGTRTKRQLIANTYKIGDQVRSALLSGYLDDEGKETTESRLELKGQVEVLGKGQATVLVNSKPAIMNNGSFTASVDLALGENSLVIEVYVDDLLTNRKTVKIVRKASGSTDTGGIGYVKPERILLNRELGSDGRSILIATVNESQLLEELKQLQLNTSSLPIFTYSVEGKDDLIQLNLPVGALLKALKELPDGIIAVETHLGRLEIPIRALESAFAGGSDTDTLQLVIGKSTAKQSDDMNKQISLRGGTQLGDSLEIKIIMVAAQTKQERTLSILNGYARWIIAVPAGTNSARMTALVSRSSGGELLFVPALIKTEDGNSYAELLLTGSGNYAVIKMEKIFADVNGHWAADDITLLASKWIIQGMGGSSSKFAPNEPITRAQFATLLVRALGLSEDAGSVELSDVKADDWFAGAVGAAKKAGLISGFEDGTFRPDVEVTREQISVMLLNALKFVKAETKEADADALDRFKDRETLAAWSEAAIAIVVQSGLMEGRPNNGFDPQASATRAEGAVVLKRLLQLAGFING